MLVSVPVIVLVLVLELMFVIIVFCFCVVSSGGTTSLSTLETPVLPSSSGSCSSRASCFDSSNPPPGAFSNSSILSKVALFSPGATSVPCISPKFAPSTSTSSSSSSFIPSNSSSCFSPSSSSLSSSIPSTSSSYFSPS